MADLKVVWGLRKRRGELNRLDVESVYQKL